MPSSRGMTAGGQLPYHLKMVFPLFVQAETQQQQTTIAELQKQNTDLEESFSKKLQEVTGSVPRSVDFLPSPTPRINILVEHSLGGFVQIFRGMDCMTSTWSMRLFLCTRCVVLFGVCTG